MTEDYDELFLIDSNLIIYAYDKDEIAKQRKSEEILTQCFRGNISLAVSNQNLAEFVSVVTKKNKLSWSEAMINAQDIINFAGFKKINYDINTIISAIEIAKEFKTSFWDALLAATMRENGIFNIYTENVNDFKMPWIKAVNPLR